MRDQAVLKQKLENHEIPAEVAPELFLFYDSCKEMAHKYASAFLPADDSIASGGCD